jgi:hypothetical protein
MNDALIKWDLLNKCWLYNSTGFQMNTYTTDQMGRVYMGGPLGFIYRPEQTGVYGDSSTASKVTITYGAPTNGSTVVFTGLPTDGTVTFTKVASSPGANEFTTIGELATLIDSLASFSATNNGTIITLTPTLLVTGQTLTGTGSYSALNKIFRDGLDDSTGTITSYWRTGWMQQSSFETITEARKLTLAVDGKASGFVTASWGYDFNTDASSVPMSMITTNGSRLVSTRLVGRGNVFNLKLQHSSSTVNCNVQEFQISGKAYGQKDPTAS